MKTGFIVPVKYLEKFAVQSDFHLILPHIVEQSEKYKKFYMERIKEGDFVMLDNSIFELEVAYPKEKLLDTALEIGVQEMVVPEVLRSSHGSLEKVEDFFDYIANSHLPKHLRFAITVQGKSFREMIAYVSALLTSFEFHTLCVPFDIDCEIPGAPCFQSSTLQRVVNRIYFCEHLREKFPSLCSTKQVHLLGLADGVELQHYTLNCAGFSFIRSNDSSSAFVHGLHGIKYTERGLPCEKIVEKLDFFMDTDLTCDRVECIQYNIIMLKKFTTGVNNG